MVHCNISYLHAGHLTVIHCADLQEFSLRRYRQISFHIIREFVSLSIQTVMCSEQRAVLWLGHSN